MWHRPGNGATRRPASAAGFPPDSSSDSARFLAPSFLLLSRYIVNDERPDIRTFLESFRVKIHGIRVPSTSRIDQISRHEHSGFRDRCFRTSRIDRYAQVETPIGATRLFREQWLTQRSPLSLWLRRAL